MLQILIRIDAGYADGSGNTVIGTDAGYKHLGATVVDQLNMTDGGIKPVQEH